MLSFQSLNLQEINILERWIASLLKPCVIIRNATPKSNDDLSRASSKESRKKNPSSSLFSQSSNRLLASVDSKMFLRSFEAANVGRCI